VWPNLQMKVVRRSTFVSGSILLMAHTAWVLLIDRVSRRNWEFEHVWGVQYYLDVPISWCAAPLYDFVVYISNSEATWFNFGHNFYFCFCLVAGGAQYFLWGWLIAALWKKLLRPRCPAHRV